MPLPFRKILQISRPRFWSYLAGTFLIGCTYGVSDPILLFNGTLFLFFLYFTFPANFFLYGINDVYDWETDQHNPKKKTHEALVEKQDHDTIKALCSVIVSLGMALCILHYTPLLGALLLIFFFLSFFYSAPPVRFKVRPLLDSTSNVLYILPGVIGYVLASNTLPSVDILLAGSLWCMAMHAYSAIPDIASDTKAHMQTVATFLGKNGALLFCLLCYGICSAILLMRYPMLGGISLLYPLLICLHFFASEETTSRYYWFFPWINMGAGAFLVIMRLLHFV